MNSDTIASTKRKIESKNRNTILSIGTNFKVPGRGTSGGDLEVGFSKSEKRREKHTHQVRVACLDN